MTKFMTPIEESRLLDEVNLITTEFQVYSRPFFINYVTDYLDPFLSETWGNVSDVMGFRSVLKLTPSHPRNPKYK